MIYICVPAHDEGQTVGVVLWKVRQVLGDAGRDYQILVADDGSTDKTPAVLEPYTRVLPLTVMRSDRCRGYTASLEMLLREAVHRSEYPRRDVIVVLQADFTEDPDHIAALLKRIESGADIAASAAPARHGAGLRNRFAEMATRYLLRKLTWPEGYGDPLTGFHAYRVSAVRRAFEVLEGPRRLLRWEGPLANVELFQAAQPHARRIDVVEWLPTPERRQRPTRDDPGSRLRLVWAYTRNREPAGVIPVASLAPTQIRTARTAEHEVSAEALRAAGVTRPGEAEQPRRQRKRSRNGTTSDGVKDGRRRRRAAESGSEERPRRRKRSEEDGPRQKRRRSESDDAAEIAATGDEAGTSKKKRRRRRRKKPEASAESATATDTSTPDAVGPDAAGQEGDASEGGEADRPSSRRRRRGRRGGRRRRKPADGSTAGDSPDTETPAAE